jgi:hypothetical protein
MNLVRHLPKATLMAALIAMVTFNLVQAAPARVSVTDPVGDNTGPVDVIGMDFEFNNETGNYTILLTATDAEPFAGDFRVNINLFNLDVGTTADDPSWFQDTINDFSLLVPSTALLLSGTNARLLSWDTGDRILLNNLPDGTPHPDGGTLFSSVVAGRPSQSLENDVIGLDKEIAIVTSIPPDLVDLSGTIKTVEGTGICAMVLASGQLMFSCNPVGVFSLTDLPRESNGTVKRQIYADGFFPKIDILPGSSTEDVVMTRSGTCPGYNTPYDPGVFPDAAGKRIDISGKVLLQDTQTPICAIVLANGQYMFSCDGSGSYALNIPLDNNGQFKLQVYADGFAPTIQTFDEFQAINDVRMARAAECQ